MNMCDVFLLVCHVAECFLAYFTGISFLDVIPVDVNIHPILGGKHFLTRMALQFQIDMNSFVVICQFLSGYIDFPTPMTSHLIWILSMKVLLMFSHLVLVYAFIITCLTGKNLGAGLWSVLFSMMIHHLLSICK